MKAAPAVSAQPQLIPRPMDGTFAPGVAHREILVRGAWTAAKFGSVPTPGPDDIRGITGPVILDCRESGPIDTTGAAVLADLLRDLGGVHEILAADGEQRELLRRVLMIDTGLVRKPIQAGLIPFVGTQTITIFRQLCNVISLLGEVVLVGTGAVVSPRHFRGAELMTQLYSVCLMAIAVVSLVTFLIGVVVAYLFSLQAARYGANIFVVDGVGLAMLRELCPILVAVVVAGRTGSAFTAQIGAMKMNEELDALEMLGLSTYSVVVVPRVVALILAMPLLVFVGDCVGMIGAALIARNFLGITPSFFLDRFLQVIPLKAYLIGVIKAPVFGLVVGLIACSMGLSVERNAQSLGMRTTSTVVQSIVAVIILNAAFAVVCATIGW